MKTGTPDLVAMSAALILVAMPPAIAKICGVISLMTGIGRASGFFLGLSLYRPGTSVKRTRRSAFKREATWADRVSLSPIFSSSMAMVSFSLMMGMTRRLKRTFKAVWAFW